MVMAYCNKINNTNYNWNDFQINTTSESMGNYSFYELRLL